MAHSPPIVRTKFVPPLPRKKLLDRPRLTEALDGIADHCVTIVQAGPGYGKSTALAAYLAGNRAPAAWYSVSGEDADSNIFIAHLIWSLRSLCPSIGGRSLAILEERYDHLARNDAIDLLANDILDMIAGDFVIVIDDYHLVGGNPEVSELVERLINNMPSHCHVVLLTRERPSFGSLARWRVKGEALELAEEDLAFTGEEISALFTGIYDYTVTPDQVDAISERTEGWIIALEMTWHALRGGAPFDSLLVKPQASLASVFDYLAQEVLVKQPSHVVEFLIDASILGELEPEVCSLVSGRDDSADILSKLSASGLFVYMTSSGGYRFHNLLKDHLQRLCRKDLARWVDANRKAADYYWETGEGLQAVDHLIAAGDWEVAAEGLSMIAAELVKSGRYDALAGRLGDLPGTALEAYPDLLLHRADVYRLTSDYVNALAWYAMADEIFAVQSDNAGRVRALKGKAMVYLDTVQPAKSEKLLSEAFALVAPDDRLEQAALLRMMAETKTNEGQIQAAVEFARSAEQLINQAMEDELDIRVHLRTGRLSTALDSLRRRVDQESRSSRPSRSHRETQLLLSLVYSLIGEGDKARKCAEAGIALGRDLKAPFVEAVGYMRLGHACHISPSPGAPDAEECYRRALEIADQIGVARGRAEPLMGLALLHAARGEAALAEKEAREALEICQSAGDEWLAGFVQLGVGAGLASSRNDLQASAWLEAANETFARCGDEYCATVCSMWLAVLAMHRQEDEGRLKGFLEILFRDLGAHSYEFLFTKRTLFGPPDLGTLVPLLIEASRLGVEKEHVDWLRSVTGLPELEYHPGYTLHIRTLGRFALYRGTDEVPNREWQREKARSLFQLLVVNRKTFLHRDRIFDALWPGLDSDNAAKHLKVAFNTMLNVLEPHRPPRLSSFCVIRDGPLYGFNPHSGYWVDADEFESLATKAGRLAETDPDGACDLYRSAIDLYRGDFLPECLYEDWATVERERLLALYLRSAQNFAELLLAMGQTDECINVCEQIIAKDVCWEEAYRLLILCYLQRGNKSMALRAYERCESTLRDEMGVGPSRDTVSILERVRMMPER
ncbi:MAG: BTAD domain-containing putative transcriptional regulator [Bacillota bacterium]